MLRVCLGQLCFRNITVVIPLMFYCRKIKNIGYYYYYSIFLSLSLSYATIAAASISFPPPLVSPPLRLSIFLCHLPPEASDFHIRRKKQDSSLPATRRESPTGSKSVKEATAAKGVEDKRRDSEIGNAFFLFLKFTNDVTIAAQVEIMKKK